MSGGRFSALTGLGIDSAIRGAVDLEETIAHGCAAGLSKDEAHEVITAWIKYHQSVTRALDWREVRRACMARAMGERWAP